MSDDYQALLRKKLKKILSFLYRGENGILCRLLINGLQEAAAYGSCFTSPGAVYFIPHVGLPLSREENATEIFQNFVELLNWIYAPETSDMSLAQICSHITPAHGDWTFIYRHIVRTAEDMLVWGRHLTDEERLEMRWRISERYNIFINEELEL